MAIYQTADEAGQKVRRRGQAISGGDYVARQMFGDEMNARIDAQMQRADEYMRSGRKAIATPQAQPSKTYDQILSEAQADLDQKYSSAAPSPEVQPSGGTVLGDVGRSLGRGAIGLVGGVNEVANLLTFGAPDAAARAISGTTPGEVLDRYRRDLNTKDSAELQAQRAELEKADGFVDSFAAVVSNPRLAGMMVLEMGPQLLTVAGAARLAAARAFSAASTAGLSAEAAQAQWHYNQHN